MYIFITFSAHKGANRKSYRLQRLSMRGSNLVFMASRTSRILEVRDGHDQISLVELDLILAANSNTPCSKSFEYCLQG